MTPATAVDAETHFGQAFAEYLSAHVSGADTRAAYAAIANQFLAWVRPTGLELHEIRPVHVEGYVRLFACRNLASSAEQHVAVIRTLFDHLVATQVVRTNPAAARRQPAVTTD